MEYKDSDKIVIEWRVLKKLIFMAKSGVRNEQDANFIKNLDEMKDRLDFDMLEGILGWVLTVYGKEYRAIP